MEKKFAALRTIAVIIKVIAWVFLFLAIVGFIATLVGAGLLGQKGGVGVAIVVLVGGFIYFLFLYAWAELIHLFLSIEENVRSIARHKKEE